MLTQEEVATANQAIDQNLDKIHIRPRDQRLDGDSEHLRGEHGRGELGGLLELASPWCDPFRLMLAHAKILSYLNQILGQGFRMDHHPFLLSMDKGTEGHLFHGSSGPGFDPNQYYIFRHGRMHNGLTVVAFQLTDVNEGDHQETVVNEGDQQETVVNEDIQQETDVNVGDQQETDNNEDDY